MSTRRRLTTVALAVAALGTLYASPASATTPTVSVTASCAPGARPGLQVTVTNPFDQAATDVEFFGTAAGAPVGQHLGPVPGHGSAHGFVPAGPGPVSATIAGQVHTATALPDGTFARANDPVTFTISVVPCIVDDPPVSTTTAGPASPPTTSGSPASQPRRPVATTIVVAPPGDQGCALPTDAPPIAHCPSTTSPRPIVEIDVPTAVVPAPSTTAVHPVPSGSVSAFVERATVTAAGSSTGATLPSTGWAGWPAFWLACICTLLGVGLVAAGRTRPRGSR